MGAMCCWFAMRATYKREFVAQEYLTGKGFEVFVPLKKVIKVVRGIKRKVTEPAIKGLIFVKGEREALKKAKFGVEYLQYITGRDGGRNVPIIVPERQMEQFIAVVQDAAVDKTFYAPDEVNISSGTKVRVHGGPFDGFEGVLVRVQGKRNKQFFINIDGLVAVNTVVKNVELLEVME
jgi:transcription antitermination factor NusG